MHVVTRTAIIKRINRRLAREGRNLRVCREDSRWLNDIGRYYVVDHNNHPDGPWLGDDVGLESFARELGAIAPDERLG